MVAIGCRFTRGSISNTSKDVSKCCSVTPRDIRAAAAAVGRDEWANNDPPGSGCHLILVRHSEDSRLEDSGGCPLHGCTGFV